MNQAQNLNDAIGPKPIDDKVTRLANAAHRFNATARKPEWVGTYALKM